MIEKLFLRKLSQITGSENLQNFADKNLRYFELAKNLSDEYLNYKKEEKGLTAAIKLLFFSSFYILDCINQGGDSFHFGSKYKRITENKAVAQYIYSLLNSIDKKPFVVSEDISYSYKKIEIDGVIFAWTTTNKNFLYEDDLFVESPSENFKMEYEIIRNLFWKKFESNRVILNCQKTFEIKEDLNFDFIPYSLCDKISAEIKGYLSHGFGHSEMLVGPPGTGKTNLLKGIAASLGRRSIRFSNFEYPGTLFEFVKILRPEVIIIDDIDRILSTTQDLLASLEEISNQKDIVLLTSANSLHKMDDATIRAGRFSKIREIVYLDPEVVHHLVDKDDELFQICKELPVSCIKEVMKRVHAFGKERALNKEDIGIEDVLYRAKKASMNKDYSMDLDSLEDSNKIKFQDID